MNDILIKRKLFIKICNNRFTTQKTQIIFSPYQKIRIKRKKYIEKMFFIKEQKKNIKINVLTKEKQ